MIVVDSSAFIEYYRPSGEPVARAAVSDAIRSDLVVVNGIIQVELMAFAAREADHASLGADFQAFHWLELGRRDFDLAAEIGFGMRSKGITIPATDLIIAACAIHSGAILYHLDAHFDRIAQHTNLDARHLGQQR
ncbi:MAG: PIN domain-containing protein [Acidobacteriota bacterium]